MSQLQSPTIILSEEFCQFRMIRHTAILFCPRIRIRSVFPLTHPHVMSAGDGCSCSSSANPLLDVDVESLDASDAPEWTQSTTISEVSSLEDF